MDVVSIVARQRPWWDGGDPFQRCDGRRGRVSWKKATEIKSPTWAPNPRRVGCNHPKISDKGKGKIVFRTCLD